MDNIDCKKYKKLGAHIVELDGEIGVRFSVWAPNAQNVSVVGDFNNWNGENHSMIKNDDTGEWTLFIKGLKEGTIYKYRVKKLHGDIVLKADPYGFYQEVRPNTASIVYNVFDYEWKDVGYRRGKRKHKMYEGPINIYEVHLGSWKRKKDGSLLTYSELSEELVDYVCDMGYTHIEIMPLVEHPFDGSWGYQGTGYFSITSRYGEPKDFMHFVDKCHQNGIGVILDWVPAHFCKDNHGLAKFDGTALYEYFDCRKSENHMWGTLNFDVGREEVASFLISSAMFFLEVFHIDGIRVDAVSSMLHLDFCREEGEEWVANDHGGHENLDAIKFLKNLNETVFKACPNTLMIAEESTNWPMVSRPTYLGGLGFNYKWNMGWMNDILEYMEIDTSHRRWNHNLLTFSMMYAYSENFILPLSHDEVVHGKKSLLDKIPGDYWQKFANLRLLYGFMVGHPGKKLLFMGGEFGQFIEWKYDDQLDWFIMEHDLHKKMHNYTKTLNEFYKTQKPLWQLDLEQEGFEWIDANAREQSVASFIRKGKKEGDLLVILCNFTPQVYLNYKVGVPYLGEYKEVFNSDEEKFGGSGIINYDTIIAKNLEVHKRPYSIEIKVPPLGVTYIKLNKLDKSKQIEMPIE